MGYIPDHLKDKEYYAGKAGSFSGVPLRTVQTWTEKGLVKPVKGTGGTGDKRKYSALNCIEIAIIKYLADDRMSLDTIKKHMDFLRRPHTYTEVDGKLIPVTNSVTNLEKLLVNKPGFLVYELSEEDSLNLSIVTSERLHELARKRFGKEFDKAEKDLRDLVIKHQAYETLPMEDLKKVILNISLIADKVLEKMS